MQIHRHTYIIYYFSTDYKHKNRADPKSIAYWRSFFLLQIPPECDIVITVLWQAQTACSICADS